MKSHVAISIVLTLLVLCLAGPAHAGSCLTAGCHVDITALKKPHAPVKEEDCTSCHKQLVKEHPVKGAKSFSLSSKQPSLCFGCHDAFGKKKFQHSPVKDGECTACHRPHGSNQPFLLEAGEDRAPLCLNCHESDPFKQKYMHGPAAVGSCNTCHEPHEANEKALMKGPVRDVCLKCHADFAAAFNAAPVVHPPVRDDACTACHNPHGSPVKMFLKNKMPELCLGCHKSMAASLAAVKVPHKPVISEGACANCHSAHYGKAKGLLAADQMTVCLGCHGVDNLGTPPLKNIKKQIEGKPYLHGPIKKGSCKACHNPHGSAYFRLLPGNYPSELYYPYQDGAYDACLKCHEKNLLRFPETTIYTNFRNGNRNLHYVHVVSRKGRTCRICHQPHASDGPKLINKNGAEFGEWKIPINFVITPTGGSCAPGCHRKLKYDRFKPESY
ncbi:cytochrome c [Geomonas sp. Red276]